MVERKEYSLAVKLVAITFARLLINIGVRTLYPFIPALAVGLGVSVREVTRLVTLRNAAGFLSPVFGPLSERYGRKLVLIGSMLLFGLGCLLVVVWPSYWLFGVTISVIAITKVIYDPAMQAFVGDAVPYARRGKAIAVTEYSWALALLVGAPAVGFAIQHWGWTAPFLGLAILSALAIPLLMRVVPADRPEHDTVSNLSDSIRFVRRHPVISFSVVYITLVMMANEMLFIVFGIWMVDSFGLSIEGLGIAAAVIGGSEIVGETIAGWSVDHFGKRPVIITTGILNALCYLLLPYTSGSVTTALITIFFVFLTFEITVVGGVPLLTELVPDGRAVVMSMNLFASAIGRTLGAFLGVLVWEAIGFQWSALVWAVIMGTAVIVLARWVREGTESQSIETESVSTGE